ncbi:MULTISPECIES: hypothetical protein [Agrobacterium]|uniref:hypothetical protein n=1 Tax=Agrobacterium TaxID=357 RepID=UPI001E2B8FB0|nr:MULTISPECIES: hypothetical protein [Agrobacterium]
MFDFEALGLQLLRDRLFGLTVDEDAVDAVAGGLVDRVEFEPVGGTRCCVKSCPARDFPELDEALPLGPCVYSPYPLLLNRYWQIKFWQVPFARWNGDYKVWEIPFASYDDLHHRWETVEEAAKRSEPEERRKRAEARRGTEEEARAKRRTTERRKRRLPVSSDDLPPLGRPVATAAYGILFITDVSGEIVDPEQVAEHHPAATEEHVWAGWRPSILDELVHTWPARSEPGEYERLRGWWNPTLDELREARTSAKSRERRKSEYGWYCAPRRSPLATEKMSPGK